MNASSYRQRVSVAVMRILLIGSLLTAWELLAVYKIVDIFFISQPSAIFSDLVKAFISREIQPHLWITLQEAMAGLLIGTVTGVALAFALGKLEVLAYVLDPIIIALYGIPKLALGPIFILWFGLGIESKVFLATIMVFFLVFFNAFAGFRNVDPTLIDAVRLMGASNSQVMRKVVFPSSVPWILAGIKAGLGAALLGAIVGEYIGANAGLGWMIEYAGGMYDITRVFSCIIVLMVIMATLNSGLRVLEKHMLRWRPSSEQTSL
ncbi:MAG: ABC transporter permease [Actinobacteria bacterium]|nr:ABC transporter permease [Actinomycetota bacterium]